jgi:hypothetical protein
MFSAGERETQHKSLTIWEDMTRCEWSTDKIDQCIVVLFVTVQTAWNLWMLLHVLHTQIDETVTNKKNSAPAQR